MASDSPRFREQQYIFESVIHPSSIIASEVHIEDGIQIMAGAVIFAESKLPNFVAGRQPCSH